MRTIPDADGRPCAAPQQRDQPGVPGPARRRPRPSGRRLPALLLVPVALCLALHGALGLVPPPPLLDGVPFGRVVLDAGGGLMRVSLARDDKCRLRVSLDAIAPEAVRALLWYEDRHFYRHPGINPFALLRAAASLRPGAPRRLGASTITMQVARLRLGLRTGSVAGKLRQLWTALLLERHYSKQDILEAYFNLAPYGGNIEGIEAAARCYFNKPAAQLTDLECRALAVTPQNPVRRHPVHGPEFDTARRRIEHLLARADGREDEPLPPLRVRPASRLPFAAPHLTTELLTSGRAEASEGGHRAPGQDSIRTWIEPDLQLMVETALTSLHQRGHAYGIDNAAALLVHGPDMRVCALAGSADFFAPDIQGQVDGTLARRSPGSTLKPFIYALALEQGLIHPRSMLNDSPRSFGGYDPENFDKGFRGPLAADEALRASRNLPAIALTEQLAAPGLYGFLQSAGVQLPRGPDHYGLALALGGAEVSMRELAALYAMLGNQGLWRPLALTRDSQTPPARRLLSPEAAHVALRMLERDALAVRGPAGPVPVRCKTGTSNGFRDAWTAGMVGDYVLVVWAGNFDNSANPLLVGADVALPLFMEIARGVAARRGLRDPLPAREADLNVVRLPVCAATGDIDVALCRDTVETLFIPGVSPTRSSGILRPVLVDRATGLRSCPESDKPKDTVMWEFWSTEQRQLFAMAGVTKAGPPEWLPACRPARGPEARNGATGSLPPTGAAPRILLPKKHVTYHSAAPGAAAAVPLRASTDADARRVHWFAGRSYIGESSPGETLVWRTPALGTVEIVAVDDLGRSTRQRCIIRAAP